MQQLSAPLTISSHLQLVSVTVRYTSQQSVFLYDAYVKYDLLESVGENLVVRFVVKEFPAHEQFIVW
jgi:hypothetical protein